ncbi:uncharacterized protein LOC129988563 isoform X2 [Argiope bruennichi]|uniref:uncharacterized protein LOC129988563 isoform X2 n=1 Tax=Argiope bruennichi TaxID=94029 RepID=UPI002493DD65|nr:uncharacterized protein LOC129988563 isoform X2 [Argiope bruennichi]
MVDPDGMPSLVVWRNISRILRIIFCSSIISLSEAFDSFAHMWWSNKFPRRKWTDDRRKASSDLRDRPRFRPSTLGWINCSANVVEIDS